MTEAFNTTAFSIYFDELFPGYFHTYKYRFYVSFSMLMVIKIIAKKEPERIDHLLKIGVRFLLSMLTQKSCPK